MTSDGDVLATLVMLLGRLERLNDSTVAEVARRHDTSPAELRVLALLRYGAVGEAVSPTEISASIVQTSGGLTATLHRLEAAGLVGREPDPDDGRGRLVTLTGAGAQRGDVVFSDLVGRYRDTFAGLDVDGVLDIVRALVGAFERAAGQRETGDWTLPVTALDGAPS